ncbi:peptidyl-tRNA hydrolase domain-containing protein, partial [Cryomyces antarcticus]
ASSPRASGVDEEELEAARRWLASFDPETIPKSMCDISFSRSSGPGGQNVNKVSSKATLRLPLDSLLPMIPSVLHSQIRSSRYCAEKSNSLVIQADDNRKQNDNVHSCFSKLHNLILEVGRDVVPGETSNAQRSRVKNLQKAENEARLRMKKTHGSKKSARRGGGR